MRVYSLSTAYTDDLDRTHYVTIDLDEDNPIVHLLLDDTHTTANELTLHYPDHTSTRFRLLVHEDIPTLFETDSSKATIEG